MRRQPLLPFVLCFVLNLSGQTLYVPGGTGSIGSSNNSNVGIGTGSSPTLLGLYGTDPQKAPFSVDRYYDGALIHFRYGLNPVGGEIGMTYYTNGGVALWVGAKPKTPHSAPSGHKELFWSEIMRNMLINTGRLSTPRFARDIRRQKNPPEFFQFK